MKKLTALLLSILMLISVVPTVLLSAAAEETEEDVEWIEVSTPEDLYFVRNNLSANYRMTCDIDLTEALAPGGSLYNETCGWVPIGYISDTSNSPFTGVFDGNGHTITGLSTHDYTYGGLFYENQGTIQNLTLDDVSIKNVPYAGAVCYLLTGNNSSVVSCSTYGTIDYNVTNVSAEYIGGICGLANGINTTFDSCINHIDISCQVFGWIGGICGVASIGKGYCNFLHCVNYGSVLVRGAAAGIVGKSYGRQNRSTFSCCANFGVISGTYMFGGIAGCCDRCDLSNVFNAGYVCIPDSIDVNTVSLWYGGIVGVPSSSCSLSCVYSCSDGSLPEGCTPLLDAAVSTEYRQGNSCENCYYSNQYASTGNHEISATKLSDALMQRQAAFAGFDFDNVWTMGTCDYKYPIFKFMEESQHDYQTTVTNPTCTEPGATKTVCSKCGDTKTVEGDPALGHNYGEWTTSKEATCIAKGEETRTCIRCSDKETRATDALGHNGDWATTKKATCLEAGEETCVCLRCGLTTTRPISMLGHDFGNWSVTKAATCTDAGIEKRICSRCAEYETRELTATGHQPGGWTLSRTATCTEAGVEKRVCANCAYFETRTVDPTGHSFGTWNVFAAATCTQEGVEKRICTVCGSYETRQTEKAAHQYTDFITEPTCTEMGYTTHICSGCGAKYTDGYQIEKGHSFGAWKTVIEATCTENGKASRVCERCGAAEEKALISTGHSYRDTVTAPTCDARGYTTHTCTSCGDTRVDTYTDALGHTLVPHNGLPATCTQSGYEPYDTCVRCDYTTYREIAPIGHPYRDTVTAPTCLERGYTTHICPACGDTKIDTYTDALGHSYNLGKCTRCGVEDPNYVAENPFTDIRKKDWFYNDVLYAYSHGLFSGTTPNTFEPNVPTSRAMIVTVLWRMSGEPTPSGKNPFTDVKKSAWYGKAVMWAAENGIVSGTAADKYAPDLAVTREQIAKILYGYAQFKGYPTDKTASLAGYPDSKKVSKWAKEYFSWALAEKLITGAVKNGQTVLDPQGEASRAVVASILVRFAKTFES